MSCKNVHSFSFLNHVQRLQTTNIYNLQNKSILKTRNNFRPYVWTTTLKVTPSKVEKHRKTLIYSSENDANTEPITPSNMLPKVSIEYCTGCRWMLRAAWNAQELLTTFQDDLHSVTLIPSKPPSPGGTFIVKIMRENEEDFEIWNRKEEKRFPEAKELKQRIRDIILPDRDLGHSDVGGKKIKTEIMESSDTSLKKNECEDCEKNTEEENDSSDEMDFMDDDEASDMRDFFGVA